MSFHRPSRKQRIPINHTSSTPSDISNTPKPFNKPSFNISQLDPTEILQLHSIIGNQAIQRVLEGEEKEKEDQVTAAHIDKIVEVDDAINYIKDLPIDVKKQIIHHQDMSKIREKFGKKAAVIMAALMEGKTGTSWSANGVTNFRTYKSPFLTNLNKNEDEIKPIQPATVLCFENVLYAAYLGGVLNREQVSVVLQSAGARSESLRRDMPVLWKRLGYDRNADQRYHVDGKNPVEKIKEGINSIALGTLIFLGPAGGDSSPQDPYFKNEVPWHVGISLGGGIMIGLPSSSKDDYQTREPIADHLKSESQVMVVGEDISAINSTPK